MVNTEGWSAMKKLKHSLLRRAFDQNRGPEVILLIQWRAAAVRHAAEKDAETLKKFHEKNAGQPRAIRALNLIEETNGSGVTHRLSTEPEKPRTIFERLAAVPEENRILFDPDPSRSSKIAAHENVPPLHADRYDPMEGLRVVTGYDLACRDMEMLARPRQRFTPPVLKN